MSFDEILDLTAVLIVCCFVFLKYDIPCRSICIVHEYSSNCCPCLLEISPFTAVVISVHARVPGTGYHTCCAYTWAVVSLLYHTWYHRWASFVLQQLGVFLLAVLFRARSLGLATSLVLCHHELLLLYACMYVMEMSYCCENNKINYSDRDTFEPARMCVTCKLPPTAAVSPIPPANSSETLLAATNADLNGRHSKQTINNCVAE